MPEMNIRGKRIGAAKGGSEAEYYGRLVMYSIGSMLVPRNDLEEQFRANALPGHWAPSKKGNFPIQAFKNACKESEGRTVGEDRVTKYLVRSLGAARRFVREVQDLAGNQLSYEEIGEWKLEETGDKSDPYRFTSKVLSSEANGLFAQKSEEVKLLWRLNQTHVRESQLRDALKRSLREMGRVEIRESGGVPFVPELNRSYIDAWEAVLSWCNENNVRDSTGKKGGRVALWPIPVVDIDSMKDMIHVRFQEQALKDMEELVADTVKAVKASKDGHISHAQYMAFEKRYRDAAKVKVEYEQLIGLSMNKAESSLDWAKEALVKLMGKVNLPTE